LLITAATKGVNCRISEPNLWAAIIHASVLDKRCKKFGSGLGPASDVEQIPRIGGSQTELVYFQS